MRINMRSFRVIQGCPVRADIAPYIAMCVDDVRAEVESIYRGDGARAILNKHGKHSQYQLYHATPAERAAWGVLGTPNRPGHSTHELFSDGVAFPGVPDGQPLPWWCQGFDVNDADAQNVINAAARHGWILFRPYGSGIEYHHLCFLHRPKRPRVGSADWRRLWRLRLTMARS